MKIGYWKAVCVLSFAVSLLVIGGVERLWAAPQPVLQFSEAEQLRSLAFGVSSGTSLIVRSRHVESVQRSGAGSSSQYGFAEEGGLMQEILWLRLHNAGSESWSNCSVEFTSHTDVSRYNSVLVWVRALVSNQRFLITLQDRGWKNKVIPQALSPYIPLWGLPQDKILQVVIPFKALTTHSSLDFARLSRLGFQFGRATAGNVDGDIIEVLGIAFVKQPQDQTRILFVDLSGAIEKHPSAPVQARAPEPTHYPKPVFASKPTVQAPPLPRTKTGQINFAIDPTYFEPVSYGVTAFRDPSSYSQPIGILEEGKSYLGLRSQKIDNETWFLLDIDERTSGWVSSIDVDFAVSKND